MRFRIDGVLVETATVQRRMVLGVISRVKIMSDLDISERRIPQDGRVGLTIDGHHIDLRVVTLPSVHGESVVIRILDKSSIVMELEKLGMAAQERERFERAFHQAYGAVLVTGPTGSGKSTTLYAALAALNTIEKNIITIEDPVEYQLDGITQVQVNPRAGLHFPTGLRSMMRADPDIIMVGEIRDRETAQIAIESALTGHLVLSTLHTNDAASAVTRLVDMGIEPFLVASAIDCVVAQRLARKLCQHCKERGIITAEVLRANGIRSQFDMEAYEPTGCARCNHTGYKGRIGLYEVMIVTEEIRKLTLARAPGPGDRRGRRAPGHAPHARRRPREGPPRHDLDPGGHARRPARGAAPSRPERRDRHQTAREQHDVLRARSRLRADAADSHDRRRVGDLLGHRVDLLGQPADDQRARPPPSCARARRRTRGRAPSARACRRAARCRARRRSCGSRGRRGSPAPRAGGRSAAARRAGSTRRRRR